MARRKKVDYLLLQVNKLLSFPPTLSVTVTIDRHDAPGSTGVRAGVVVVAQAVSRPPAPPVVMAGGGRGLDRNGAREALGKPVERQERDQTKIVRDQRKTAIREREPRNRDVKITMVSNHISWLLVNILFTCIHREGILHVRRPMPI